MADETRVVPAVVEAVRDVVDAALVRPVVESRPHPRRWPPGLLAVSIATGVLYVLLAAAATAAGWLRSVDVLLVSPVTGMSLPAVSAPLLLGGIAWSMILVHAAALHTTWWPRLALFVVGVVSVAMFGAQSWGEPVVLASALLGYLLLWVFILVRSRRGYAWWEFVVVGLWVTAVLYVPWLSWGVGTIFGTDYRLSAIQGTLGTLQVLSVPALLAAGCSPALITTTAGETLASRPLPRWFAVVTLALLVAWRLGDLAWSLREGDSDLAVSNLVSSAITVGAVLVLAEVLRRRSTRVSVPGPGALPEIWSAYVWPLAMSLGWVALLMVPLSIVRVLVFGTSLSETVVEPALRWLLMYGPQVFRFAVGVVALVVAWRIAKAGQVAGALLLAAFFSYAVVQRIGPLTGTELLGAQSPAALAAVSSVVALVLLVGYAATRRLTRRRAVGLATVLLLGAIYPHRNLLDDPISALLGYAGLAVLLFGLVWQLVTNAEYTDGDTGTFPRSTRVLLYLANGLFAVTGAAYVSLARETGSTDATDWTELGDDLLGTPLFVAALVAGLWVALGRQPDERPAVSAGGPAAT